MVQRDSGTKRSVNCSWSTSTSGAGVVCVTHHACPAHPSTPVSQTFVEYLLCVSHYYQCSGTAVNKGDKYMCLPCVKSLVGTGPSEGMDQLRIKLKFQ